MVYQFTKQARFVLKELRIKNNLTQQDIADELNLTKAYISQIELGKKPLPDYRTLISWLEVFDIKPKYFEALITDRVKNSLGS